MLPAEEADVLDSIGTTKCVANDMVVFETVVRPAPIPVLVYVGTTVGAVS
jgi:hypothetical protein